MSGSRFFAGGAGVLRFFFEALAPAVMETGRSGDGC